MKARVNGIEIHYTIEGDGPWVTLSHSLACDLSMWDEQARKLAESYRVLRFDTRGHGKSEAPSGAYSLEGLGDDLAALLDHLAIGETHFVGLSMGGMIGETFALKYPGRFRSLALCDTTSRYPAEALPIWEGRIRTATEQGMEPLVQPTLERWFTARFRSAHPDVTARIGDLIRATPVAGYVGCSRAIPKINLTARLHEIACPTLIVVGDQDQGTPVAMAEEIHAAMPGSRLVVIADAAHLSNVEQPEAFNAALFGFLERAD